MPVLPPLQALPMSMSESPAGHFPSHFWCKADALSSSSPFSNVLRRRLGAREGASTWWQNGSILLSLFFL